MATHSHGIDGGRGRTGGMCECCLHFAYVVCVDVGTTEHILYDNVIMDLEQNALDAHVHFDTFAIEYVSSMRPFQA